MENVHYLHLDLRLALVDIALVKNFFDEDYDYVVNLGGYINHRLYWEGGQDLIKVHFSGLQNLLENTKFENLTWGLQ